LNTRSIRFRLAAWHAAFSAGIFVVLAGLLFVQVRAYLETTLFETQARRARQIAETLVAQLPKGGEAYLGRQIETLYAPELGDRFIRVTGPDGSVIYRSGPPADGSFDPARVGSLHDGGSVKPTRIDTLSDGSKLLIASFGASPGGRGTYWVEVGTSGEPVDQLVSRLLILLGLGLPVVALAASGGGYLLVRKALAPVEEIAGKAEVITQHNLNERLPVPRTSDELERLSIALNHMITRLDVAFGNSKRFVADASHELRTPLTIVQGELEALAKDTATPPEFREQLGSLLEEVERLARIVQQLFALSRLDAGEANADSDVFDLSALVVGTADQMALLAEDKGITVSKDAQGPVFVEGDRSRLKQVIVNLLDNAIKYTEPGGSVSLRTEIKGGLAILEVSDTGAGIPAEAIPHVFERFYRVRGDRGTSDTGAGLGLAIVKSICGAHGGKVEVKSIVGNGSLFRVSLPLSEKTNPDSTAPF
jgi:heavy metal sensor kinase